MHIAVIIPTSAFEGGVVRNTLNMLRMLALGARKHGDPLTLSFGYPEEMNTGRWRLEELEDEGIQIRPYQRQSMPAEALAPYYEVMLEPRHSAKVPSYAVFNDGISNFEDADLWLFISDHLSEMPPPHKPYGVIVYDFVNRYYPDIWAEPNWEAGETRALLVQHSAFVITTTRQTKQDVVSYVGYPARKVHVLPIEFDPLEELAPSTNRATLKQIVWPTIMSQHENHEAVLAGLEAFLRRNRSFRVIVLGPHTQQMDSRKPVTNDHPYIHRLRGIIAKSTELSSRVEFPGYVDDHRYQHILKSSAVLLHTSRCDNGSYTVIEAAWLNTPAVSARYAAMEEVAQQFELPLVFFDYNIKDDLVNKLEDAIARRDDLKQLLPDHLSLGSHSYRELASRYWEQFRAVATDIIGAATE